MELKIKEVNPIEEKSVQEVEEQLLKKHEQEVNSEVDSSTEQVNSEVDNDKVSAENAQTTETQSSELSEDDVLSYIKNRYNKDIPSVDDLFTQQEQNEPLPEDVSKYLDFKKNTGRGFEDFVKANRDLSGLSDDQLLREYYSMTESDLDAEDIQYLMEDKFGYDEELDDPKDIKKKNIAKKREISKAKKHLNELKETYSIPLESSGDSVSKETLDELQAYRNYIQQSKTAQEANQKKNEYFLKQTDKVFDSEFKGFEFNVGDKVISYAYGDTQEMRSKQLSLDSFVNKFLGEDGLISDAKGWHSALSAAVNPQKFAQYFYEQGKADAIGDVSKKSKNINMNVRQTPQAIGDTGFKARPLSQDSGKGLRIRSKKK